jgi:hypothetical protein
MSGHDGGRKPRDTDELFNHVFNIMMEQVHGTRQYFRREIVNCVDAPQHANIFGTPNFIFFDSDFDAYQPQLVGDTGLLIMSSLLDEFFTNGKMFAAQKDIFDADYEDVYFGERADSIVPGVERIFKDCKTLAEIEQHAEYEKHIKPFLTWLNKEKINIKKFTHNNFDSRDISKKRNNEFFIYNCSEYVLVNAKWLAAYYKIDIYNAQYNTYVNVYQKLLSDLAVYTKQK